MPRVTIAQTDLGRCSCGVTIDRGEAIVQTSVGIVHASCEARTTKSTVDAPAPPAGFLFALSDAAATEPEPALSDVCAFVDGASYVGQRASVFELMRDGEFSTLEQIAKATGYLETSVSARLREMRRPEFGGHGVIHRPISDDSCIREYRLVVNRDNGQRSAA